ncbi:helix-turn-helix domain-containing protein [Faecalicatena acetigenes]|uniref:Helix-turn-helix domain-containing protein n=1 Tax=Faecalicatena acetigenes TaxID=2981790 RepID=A0ABT2TBR9_9FIRM|nr:MULTISPECIES: helix-turn-helix transcriptional regulator [Lachnospiraceae]MCU6747682.1 helix-turn-helix domain-containing protein [Faecalicatena acetigenes]SCI03549.1 RapGH repressor [uncultured Clostridium sp.]
METTGEKIRNIRKEKGLTQKQLAELIGTSQQNLAQYENGKRNPKFLTIKKIAYALEVPFTQLVPKGDDTETIESLQAIRSTGEIDFNRIASAIKKAMSSEHHRINLSEELTKSLESVIEQHQKEQENDERFKMYGFPDATSIKRISDVYLKLNEEGQQKVVEYATDLSQNERYKK